MKNNEKSKCKINCLEHKYHCAKCNTPVSYSPANFASRPFDIPNQCENCNPFEPETPQKEYICEKKKHTDGICQACRPDSPQDTVSGWRKEFHHRFINDHNMEWRPLRGLWEDDITDFIAELLSKQKKEIIQALLKNGLRCSPCLGGVIDLIKTL